MALVVCNQGENLIGKAAVGKTAAATPWRLKLYSNNITPAAADTESTYTEVSGGGYAEISLTAANWSSVTGAPTVFSYPAQTFMFTGTFAPITVYGYYVVDSSGKLLFAERLPGAPFTATNSGDSVEVTPQITFGSVTND